MKSIYHRNFLLTAGLVLLSFLVLGAAFAAISYEFIVDDQQGTMRDTAQTVADAASAKTVENDLADWDLRMTISTISRATGLRIFICGTDGTVLSCADENLHCGHIGKSLPERVVSALTAHGRFAGILTLPELHELPCYVSAVPILSSRNEWVEGYVVVLSNSRDMVQIWRSFGAIFILAAVAVLIFTIAATLVATRRQTEPLKEMAAAAKRFAHGDFSVRVSGTEDRQDEIGELTEAFNSMADALEKSEQRRREFVANISHELKTPMTSISGFADGLLDGTIPTERQEEYLRIISAETKRLSRLVRKMLDVSRVQSADRNALQKKSFDIEVVLVRALASLEQKITDRNLDVEVQMPEESVLVLGDEDAITQVVYNLLDNAAKFADPGSTLRLSLWKREEKAYVAVRNRGAQIPPEELPLIFERFHKTDKSRSLDREGVGLGLYLVKTIIQNHGEEISVQSRDGVTEFKFSLQLQPEHKGGGKDS